MNKGLYKTFSVVWAVNSRECGELRCVKNAPKSTVELVTIKSMIEHLGDPQTVAAANTLIEETDREKANLHPKPK